ncbi:MAG: indole-3-glycerol phosphate synthase TrpC [Clostridia bacterium]|nr:indole-3-glycerol phosphate synthase TrpC [Clostridia bacterium]
MTILDEIAAYAQERVKTDKTRISPEQMMEEACALPGRGQMFYDAVAHPGLSFICEIKKASPSKGIIDPVFDWSQIASDYEAAGADAVSCLTEPRWFLGSDAIFAGVRARIASPMLRKDFVVDPYQIYQAKVLGANCVLLICALLSPEQLSEFLGICQTIGLAALVEAHNEAEIHSAAKAGARMIGVNNRNLKDFTVDFGNALRLRECIPENCLYVSESGVRTPEDAGTLKKIGADAVLIGEALMRAPDRRAMLEAMRRAST